MKLLYWLMFPVLALGYLGTMPLCFLGCYWPMMQVARFDRWLYGERGIVIIEDEIIERDGRVDE